MDKDQNYYYMGYQHGISDQCNKLTNLVSNIMAIANHPCKKVYPAKYLEGYAKGYEETKGKSWYIISISDLKITGYYADGTWVEDKASATKYPTRAALELAIKRIPTWRSGKCGMRLE